jgi:hypothetical protein
MAAAAAERVRREPMTGAHLLELIKTLHTIVWAFFVACILAIPGFAWRERYDVAVALVAVVMLEVLVLVFNRHRCPLTDVAARYTDDRRDNFDIYLPLWLARHNKVLFGFLYVAGVLFTAARRWIWTV